MSLSFVAPDRPLLLLDRQRVPGREVVQVLLDDDVAAAGERRVLVADQRPRRAAASPSGFSVPSTKPSRSRSSKDRKPCTSSTTCAWPRQPVHQPLRRARSTGRAGARGCGTAGRRASRGATCLAPANSGKRMQPGRARRAEQAVPDARRRCRPRRSARPRGRGSRPSACSPLTSASSVADLVLAARLDGQDEEDRRLGDRGQNGLRLGCLHGSHGILRRTAMAPSIGMGITFGPTRDVVRLPPSARDATRSRRRSRPEPAAGWCAMRGYPPR